MPCDVCKRPGSARLAPNRGDAGGKQNCQSRPNWGSSGGRDRPDKIDSRAAPNRPQIDKRERERLRRPYVARRGRSMSCSAGSIPMTRRIALRATLANSTPCEATCIGASDTSTCAKPCVLKVAAAGGDQQGRGFPQPTPRRRVAVGSCMCCAPRPPHWRPCTSVASPFPYPSAQRSTRARSLLWPRPAHDPHSIRKQRQRLGRKTENP